ncbi:ubiquinone biosynthesis protein COQ9 [Rhizodiscina lignyota]|uniref:Ubiquinone biosynthesis protein n=1 Tax=Rhizodiscina lignyota TaxID=1504668 RepID=A0A9P4IP89_9PEZI|nr:ubiquinone biosynthesis protein COQ9 [Rhizodiscina lignyota]
MATCCRRPFLLSSTSSIRKPPRAPRRSYQSSTHPPPPPYTPEASSILSSSLRHVPQHGFTQTSLTLGARDAGFLDISTNLLPRGVFELVNYHLMNQRLALKDTVQFPEEGKEAGGKKTGVGKKVRALLLARLRGNIDAGVVGRWQEALAVMALPTNIRPSLAELARLSDEMWFLAGDVSVDTSWYTKRASLSGIYAAAEVFQTQDESPNYKDTEHFVDARLDEVQQVGSTVGQVAEWLDFTGHAAVNVLRSKGVRI